MIEDAPLNTRLGRLREALHRAPCAEVWGRICALLEAWPDDATLPLALDYAHAHLDGRWPEALREPPWSWRQARINGDVPPGWSLMRWCDVTLLDHVESRARATRALMHILDIPLGEAFRLIRWGGPSRVCHITGWIPGLRVAHALQLHGGRVRIQLFRGDTPADTLRRDEPVCAVGIGLHQRRSDYVAAYWIRRALGLTVSSAVRAVRAAPAVLPVALTEDEADRATHALCAAGLDAWTLSPWALLSASKAQPS